MTPIPTPAAVESRRIPDDPSFPIEWERPGDAELQWDWDDMHMPYAYTPLAIDYVGMIAAGITGGYRHYGSPFEMRMTGWHGYCYFAIDYHLPPAEVGPMWGQLREGYRAAQPGAMALWREAFLPEVRAIYADIAAVDVEGLPGAALAEAWRAAWDRMGRAWVIHFTIIRPAYRIGEDLADLYESLIPGAPAGEALHLVQGGNDVLQAVQAGVDALVDEVAASPALRAAVSAPTPPTLDALAAGEAGTAFVAHLSGFLAEHGHLGQPFDDLTLPSWAEEPATLLAEIARKLERRGETAADRRTRLLREASALADGTRARLVDRADDLARFDATLELARDLLPLTEIHNYWIDRMAQATLRRFVRRVGARLVADGSMAEPDDVFYLRREEVPDTLEHPTDRRAVIAERRAEHARQKAIRPPHVVGRKEPDFGVTSRFDQDRSEDQAGEVLKGIGASAGVVRGPARVAFGPTDFERIRPGDVIVCPSSNPSWVPVFTIAAGLVTNTGGVLAHAAVVAREFGLPAVVGVSGATDHIEDGREVEIDGTAGTVRLL